MKRRNAATRMQNTGQSENWSSSKSTLSTQTTLRQTPMELVPAYPNVQVVTGKSEDNPPVKDGTIFGQSTFVGTTSKSCKQRMKMVKFFTKDQPNVVYNFYVRNLQTRRWQFTDTKSAGEINAKNVGAKLTVKIRYEKLPAPYAGTAVAITHLQTSIAPPDTVSPGESPDTDSSHLSLLD